MAANIVEEALVQEVDTKSRTRRTALPQAEIRGTMTRLRHHWVTRWASLTATACMLAIHLIPAPAYTAPVRRINYNAGLSDGLSQALTPAQHKRVEANRAEQEHRLDARPLTTQEMQQAQGRGYRNKYYNGVLPWQRSLRDANLCSGNLFKSFTDVQVASARGAGLLLQRTYNSNDDRIGPFGLGWTHVYDIRLEEKGLNPTTGEEETTRTDFFGGKHVYQRDADGLYTPPAYLYDELSSDYDIAQVDGPVAVLDDTEKEMDGTIKHFFKDGSERICDYIEDRHGNRTTLAYTTLAYSTKKFLSTVTDPSGRTLTFSWTNLGTSQAPAYRITQVTGPLYSVTYSYFTNAGDPTSYQNLASVTLDPGGLNRTTSFTYTSVSGTLNGQAVTENGLLSSITDPLSHAVSYAYTIDFVVNGYHTGTPTGSPWVSQVTEPGSGGNHVWTILPGSWTYLYTFMTSVTSNGGLAFKIETDDKLRYKGAIQGTGYTYKVTYDANNNVTHSEEPVYSGTYPWTYNGITVNARGMNMTYGPRGNMLSQWPDGFGSQTMTYTYYNASQYFQKQSITDPQSHVTLFGVGRADDPNLGNRGEVLWVQDAGYSVSSSPSFHKQMVYTYNTYGQRTNETNLNGVVTNYIYGDTWGNLTQIVQDPHVTSGDSHLARTSNITFDAGGRVTQTTDPMGRTSTFTFSTLGQPTQANFPATSSTPAETITYNYATNGRMTSVTDNRGTTTFSYESTNDRIASMTDPVTGTISYTYGKAGERLTMQLPGSNPWIYGYVNTGSTPSETQTVLTKDDPTSAAKMLKTITDDNGRIVEYHQDLRGRMREAIWNQVFDAQNNLVSYCWTGNKEDTPVGQSLTHGWTSQVQNVFWQKINNVWSSSLLSQNDYIYDSLGRRTSNAITLNGSSRTETYGYDELNRLTSVNYGDSHSQSYSFDSMGNRATKINDGTTESYTYNAANMLLSRGSSSYTNDANGNTLTGGGRTNTWDSQNRLYQCVMNSNTTVNTYASDGLRHRTAVTTGGTTTTTDYVLDNSLFIREQTPVNGLQVNVATYLVGLRGPEYRRDDSTGTIKWYCYDGLGSVVAEVSPSGTLTATRAYDVYGGVRSSAGASTSRHKFVGSLGHPSEDETGLIYMQARYADPVTGRFISQDQKKDGVNWFTYCGNDPTNSVDPTGHEFIAAIIGGIFGFVFTLISNYILGKRGMELFASALATGIGGAVGGLFANPMIAGFVSAFVGSLLGDLFSGGLGALNFKKALAAGAVGGGFGGISGWILETVGKAFSSSIQGLVGADVGTFEHADAALGACLGSIIDGGANLING